MKKLLKILICIIFIFAFSFSIVFLQYNDETIVALNNTFVPSEKKILEISNNSNESFPISSKKVFNEFNENTIDKNGFYLRIDEIGLFKAIIPDVDPRNKDEYVKSWEGGISHGKFTSRPDKIGLTYLFAHAVGNKDQATEKNAWFSNLDLLNLNDEIIIYYSGTKYYYEISSIMAVSPNATAFYTGASVVPMVRLQYCGPPTGSIDSRILVDALLVKQELI
jgi:sortase (surface protein transpeptidase)